MCIDFKSIALHHLHDVTRLCNICVLNYNVQRDNHQFTVTQWKYKAITSTAAAAAFGHFRINCRIHKRTFECKTVQWTLCQKVLKNRTNNGRTFLNQMTNQWFFTFVCTFRLICQFSYLYETILTSLFGGTIIAICTSMLMIQMELVQYLLLHFFIQILFGLEFILN